MKKIIFIIVFMFFICFSMNLSSDDKKVEETQDVEDISLEDMLDIEITTASKSAQKSSDAPATIMVITSEQIKARNYRSLTDVIMDLPDFKVDINSRTEFLNGINVRGVQGVEKLVILLDGQRISSPTNEPMPLIENYPVHMAKQIEVVYGPASALYGADAMSGVINIITKRPGKDQKTFFEASGSYGQFNYTNLNFVLGMKISKALNMTVSGQYFHDGQPDLSKDYPDDFVGIESLATGNYNTSFGPMTPDQKPENKYDIPIKANAFHITLNSEKFQFTFFKNYASIPTAMPYTANNAVYNDTGYYAQSIIMGSLSYHSEINENISNQISVTASKYDLLPESNFRNVYTQTNPGYKYATGSSFKFEDQLSWKASDKINIIGGLSYESFNSVPKGTDLQSPIDESKNLFGYWMGTTIPDTLYVLKYYNIGSFLQGQVTLSEKFSLTLGARYDYNSRYGSTFNPRVGLVWHPSKKSTVKLLYGSAFLAPSPYQSFQHYGSFVSFDGGNTYQSFFLHLPNPNLEPQEIDTFELSFRQYMGKNFSFSINSFYSKLSNLINYIIDIPGSSNTIYDGSFAGWPVAAIEIPTNQGEQTTYGGTARLEFMKEFNKKSKLKAYLSFSFVDGEIDAIDVNQKIDLGGISDLIIRLGGELNIGSFEFAPRLMIVGKQNTFNKEQVGSGYIRPTFDGYTLFTLSAKYKHIVDGFSIWLRVDNLLDQRYRSVNLYPFGGIEFDGVPQNPRRIIVGASYEL